jgi:DNA-binding MarR family transcriptional regulator
MTELSVNAEGNIANEVNTIQTVNSVSNIGSEVNIKISRQMRQILLFLYRDVNHVYHQVDIIAATCPTDENGYLSLSRIASFSRTIKTLIKANLVESSKAYYSSQFQCWITRRVCYYLTAKGEQFVKERWPHTELMVWHEPVTALVKGELP